MANDGDRGRVEDREIGGSGGARGSREMGPGGGDRAGENRAFDGARQDGGRDGARRGGGDAWRGQSRFGARYDAEPTGYQTSGYGGQEYGMEGGPAHRTTSERDRAWRGDERETTPRDADVRDQWSPGGGQPYGELDLNPRNRGDREFGPPADYAYHPPAGHELDGEYLRWREQRLRAHDRDYQEWRRSQQQRYDDDYRRRRVTKEGGGR